MTIIRREHGSSGAEFSECEAYRFSLWRTWTDKGLSGRLCAFIGLNPSNHRGRAENRVTNLRENGVVLHHLGLTGKGEPWHPLYKRADTQPVVWE